MIHFIRKVCIKRTKRFIWGQFTSLFNCFPDYMIGYSIKQDTITNLKHSKSNMIHFNLYFTSCYSGFFNTRFILIKSELRFFVLFQSWFHAFLMAVESAERMNWFSIIVDLNFPYPSRFNLDWSPGQFPARHSGQ